MPMKPALSAISAVSRCQAFADQLLEIGRRVGGEFEPDDPAAAAALDRAAEVADEILGLLLTSISLSRISRNAPAADLFEAGEKLVEMGADDRFDRDEAQLRRRAAG